MLFSRINEAITQTFRALRIWKTLLYLIIFLWWDSKKWNYLNGFSIYRQLERKKLRAQWLTQELINLGSAFIKLGQLLSSRPDILPAEWVNELNNLQDNVTPFSFNIVEGVIEKELGSKCKEIIDITEKPIGSASLAQVHKATLRNGKKVVLKIQRPGLAKIFQLDLEIMQQLAAALQKKHSWSHGRDWVGIAKECKRVLIRELDFRIEAQYAARFKQQFIDDPKIIVPSVIWELSSKQILCLDYVPGIKINNINSLIENNVNPSKIAEIGAISYLKQLVEFGFFHADPHPGNLSVATNGSLIFYDFGMMGVVSSRLRERIGSMIKYVALKDTNGLIQELQAAGVIERGIEIGPVRRFIRVMLKEALTPPFDSNIIEKISGDFYELMYGKPFRLPAELIFIMRALSTFEGVGRNLDPNFNLISIAKPYLLPLMTSNNSNPNDLINELGRQFGELGSKAVGIPKRLDESLERLEQGDLQLQIRLGESDRQLRRMINAQQSMGQSILLGCLGISAALLGSSSKPVYSLIPIITAFPVTLGWIKLQFKMKNESNLDNKFPQTKK